MSGEGIYCNVVRKQREVMFFSVYWKKYTHMYIHNHNLVMSLAILTTPLFFSVVQENVSCLGWSIVHQHVSVLTDLYHVVVFSVADDVYRVC